MVPSVLNRWRRPARPDNRASFCGPDVGVFGSAAVLHVFIGVVLMMAPAPLLATFAEPPPSWGVDPLRDQTIAGALAWSYGEPIALITTIIFAMRWRRDEDKASALRDEHGDSEDTELAAYNAFLKRLNTEPGRPS